MQILKSFTVLSLPLFILSCSTQQPKEKIDRKALVARHNVKLEAVDTLGALTVGNGEFAYTVDVTGLQSFPEHYVNGVPLGTQSEWGWHTSANPEEYTHDETLKAYSFNGETNSLYAVQYEQPERNLNAVNYFRANPHRLQLGHIGLEIIKEDGSIAQINDIKDIDQQLDLWTGEIESNFTMEGTPVKVLTYGDPNEDGVSVKIISPLVDSNRIHLKLKFPYPTMEFSDRGVNYNQPELHETIVKTSTDSTVVLGRTLDKDNYFVSTTFNTGISIQEIEKHEFKVVPQAKESFEATVYFSNEEKKSTTLSFQQIKDNSNSSWQSFWQSGGAVDFSECFDERAFELERRVVLSQYLTRVQCAGHYPIQETGLTYNSWYGKPHMEMYWWHGAHYPLWGRTPLLEKSIGWYFEAYEGASAIAKRQGYKGVRWQKMTDHKAGEAPSDVGSFLVWQQPHVIYLAELIYRNNPSQENLEKYQKLIFSTADFMASFAHFDAENDRYILGKGVIPAQECFDKNETFNPPFELAYWKWGLETAQIWSERLGLKPNKAWQKVLDKLSPIAKKEGVYLAAESVPNSYSSNSEHIIDHPAVLASLSMLPQNNYVDMETMNRTFDVVDSVWTWNHTWGWDFPLEAMTATRLGRPEDAIKALFREEITNTYLANGHNYQTERLTLYLPGNGGILCAVALMCAGFDANEIENPGFPKNGKWNVKWEGLKPMP